MTHQDKVLHAAIGLLIYAFLRLWFPPMLVLFVVGTIMAIKEYYDAKHPARHTPDGWDAFCGVMAPLLAGAVEDTYVWLS
jgi:hypothetical protein